MKRVFRGILALCLAAALLLAGCSSADLDRLLGYDDGAITAFADMQYTRPEFSGLEEKCQAAIMAAEAAEPVERVMDRVYAFYEDYYTFYTNYALANIYYSQDLTDSHWEEEYNYCLEATAQVDAAIDTLLYALADCPLRQELEQEEYFGPGFFDDYQGESIWDETFTALAEEEARLQSRYYELTEQANDLSYYSDIFFSTVGKEMAQLFVELVAVRQQMAAQAGYADYPSFAYDFYYGRDYTPQQTQGYLADIAQTLVPMYRTVDTTEYWQIAGKYTSEKNTWKYVAACAEAMGGTVQEAFAVMEEKGLYDIAAGSNKYSASFEIYLMDYYAPFVFMDPAGTVSDKLTFTHEFGHFCNDYASWGSVAGIDVAEFFSQGLEYLSLCYAADADMERMKMMDCLNLYVEQAAYASFELQVYALTGEELTVENVYALYEQVGKTYGFDSWRWDSRDFVLILHYYTNPMYIISYVVSNDAALQLYQLEKEMPGAGAALYEENLATEEDGFLAFVAAAGLESPFAEDRIQAVRDTLAAALN